MITTRDALKIEHNLRILDTSSMLCARHKSKGSAHICAIRAVLRKVLVPRPGSYPQLTTRFWAKRMLKERQ